MEEDAHGIKAEVLRPGEFAVDRRWIPCFRLPHFQLVDGCGGAEIATGEPRLFGIPCIGLVGGPLIASLRGGGNQKYPEYE